MPLLIPQRASHPFLNRFVFSLPRFQRSSPGPISLVGEGKALRVLVVLGRDQYF